MNYRSVLLAVVGSVICLALSLDAAAARKPKIQTGPDAEVSFDGLHRVDRATMDSVWAKPDLDLTGYRKIMLVGAGLAFKDVKSRSTSASRRSGETEFTISEKNKERLRDELHKAFQDEFEKVDRFEFTDTVGEDVLLIITSVIDVVSHVPPEPIGRTDIYLRSVGEATLVLEVRDSMTNEILVRASDRRDAEQNDHGFWTRSSPVTNWSEVRRVAKGWARLLRKRLNEVAQMTDDEAP